MIDRIGQIRRKSTELWEKLGREANDDELAEGMKIPSQNPHLKLKY